MKCHWRKQQNFWGCAISTLYAIMTISPNTVRCRLRIRTVYGRKRWRIKIDGCGTPWKQNQLLSQITNKINSHLQDLVSTQISLYLLNCLFFWATMFFNTRVSLSVIFVFRPSFWFKDTILPSFLCAVIMTDTMLLAQHIAKLLVFPPLRLQLNEHQQSWRFGSMYDLIM